MPLTFRLADADRHRHPSPTPAAVAPPTLRETYAYDRLGNLRVKAGVGYDASSRDIFGCSKNRQNRIVENSTYPLDDFGFR
jgi:hypothetical protein